MDTQTIQTGMTLFLQAANIIVLLWAFKNFLSKPHDTLEQRVSKCEEDVRDMKQSLFRGDGKFQETERAIKVLIRSVLALVEFEMQYCLTEHKQPSNGLEKAKEALDEFIAEK